MGQVSMEKLVSLAKRRGFIYPGSEIYGGLAGTWDYGPLGAELKENIQNIWWKKFVSNRDDMYGVDAAILMNPKVWEASGHTGAGFADPMVECKKCKKRFKEDYVDENKCPECKGELGESKQFNMMFKTHAGASEDSTSEIYLRPETAQGIFTNFKNIIDSFSPKMPFGIAQIGKAFRNEIAPRDFVFRSREFRQMEIEYFIREEEWQDRFEEWRKGVSDFFVNDLGLSKDKIYEREVDKDDLAHYSKKTIDFEYSFPEKNEICGLAYRTDFDLKNHSKASGTELVYRTPEGEKFIPHVIEPSFGVDRTILAVLAESYNEDEDRVWLSFKPSVAPYKVAVFPLMRNKPELVEKAREVYTGIKKYIPNTLWDDNGNVGKRYRRQDEIGTPFCVTVDFETLEDGAVTVRDRDSMEQERVAIENLREYLDEKLSSQ